MPISSLNDLVAGLAAVGRPTPVFKAAAAGQVANTWASFWKVAGHPSAAATPPTGAGEAATAATAGALEHSNPVAPALAYLAGMTLTCEDPGVVLLYDRLVHSSGLSGTATTLQAINSAALTRYTDGAGVELWLECYTATGASSRTATITYVNQEGATKTTSVTIPGSMNAGRMVPVPLAAGDTGVRSVTDLTLSASTGTAGDFGVTLLKRIAESLVAAANYAPPRDALELGLPRLHDDCCLALATYCATSSPGPVYGQIVEAKK